MKISLRHHRQRHLFTLNFISNKCKYCHKYCLIVQILVAIHYFRNLTKVIFGEILSQMKETTDIDSKEKVWHCINHRCNDGPLRKISFLTLNLIAPLRIPIQITLFLLDQIILNQKVTHRIIAIPHKSPLNPLKLPRSMMEICSITPIPWYKSFLERTLWNRYLSGNAYTVIL